jgi:hypothetical protein
MINYIRKFRYNKQLEWTIEIARLKNLFEIIIHKDEAWPLIPLIAQNILSHKNIPASKFSL